MVLLDDIFILVTNVATWFGLYLIVSSTLNLEAGFAGIPNFGKMLVVAGGGFVAGAFPGRLVAWLAGIDTSEGYIFRNGMIVAQATDVLRQDVLLSLGVLALTLALAAVIGAGLGYIATYPTIRLREEFLAMTLLGIAEVLRTFGRNYDDLVGGPRGVAVPDMFAWIGGANRFQVVTYVILGIAIVIFLYVNRLTKSPLGRVLRAVRDSEVAAETIGKDIIAFRTRALIVASALGAIGGALFPIYSLGFTAATFDRVGWTFWPWVMVLVGGMANNLGTLFGTLFFVGIRQLIARYNDYLQPYLPFKIAWLDFILLGGFLLAVIMFRPQGILPEKPIKTLSSKDLKLITGRQHEVETKANQNKAEDLDQPHEPPSSEESSRSDS